MQSLLIYFLLERFIDSRSAKKNVVRHTTHMMPPLKNAMTNPVIVNQMIMSLYCCAPGRNEKYRPIKIIMIPTSAGIINNLYLPFCILEWCFDGCPGRVGSVFWYDDCDLITFV